MKTKPTQHSVGKLREIGIEPDIIVCRTERPLEDELREEVIPATGKTKGWSEEGGSTTQTRSMRLIDYLIRRVHSRTGPTRVW